MFAILAGLFALFEYKSKDYIDRVKNSSDVIEKYLSSDEYKALAKIQEFAWSEDFIAKRNQLMQKSISSQQFRSYVSDEVKKKYAGEFFKAIRGMKAVSICAIQGRCEPLTICMYLSQSMQDFRCDFRESIADLSDANGSCVIDEINHVLDNHCSKWMSSYMGVPNYTGIKDNYCLFNKEENRSMIGEHCAQSIIFKRPSNVLDRVFN